MQVLPCASGRRAWTAWRSSPATATLPAQFLDPAVNLRENSYGGAEANRLRFLPV